MTDPEFNALVARLEPFARAEPASYRRRVVALALLGDLYLWTVLLLLLAVVAVSILMISTLKAIGIKLIIVFAPILWLLGKALWVRLPAPPGIPVTRNEAPALFAMIDEVRASVGAPEFHHVLIDGDFNAGVVQIPRLGAFGWYRNYLLIGLPLLKTMTAEQFKSVLAHEYGHLAGGHAKLGNWIYRQRRRWSRLLESLEQRGGEGGFLFMGFLNRYAPYLNAYSFPLARANEYEADATSARLVGVAAMSQALTTVNVASNYLSETYWPGIYRDADRLPEPEHKPYVSFSSRLGADVAAMPTQRWLDSAMRVTTSTADTHPALADRLAAVGGTPELALPAAGEAADRLLGAALERVTARLDGDWSAGVASGWRERFERAAAERERFAELKARLDAGETLEFDDAYAHALLLDRACDDMDASIAALAALHARFPDQDGVLGSLGSRMLIRDNEAGVALLELAITRLPAGAADYLLALRAYFERHGRHDEAKAANERAIAAAETNHKADAERAQVLATDRFIEHGVDDAAVAAMRQRLAEIPELGDAYLVQKHCEWLPERKYYVLGFGIRNRWLPGHDRKINAVMLALRTQFPFPGETSIVPFDRGNEAFRKRFAAVTGARLAG